MVILDRPYRKEAIPGLLKQVRTALYRRLDTRIDKDMNFTRNMANEVLRTFDDMDADAIYALCPFSSVVADYPGPGEFKKLYDYQKRLANFTSDVKEMNNWGNALIATIGKQLWPGEEGQAHWR